MAHKQDCPCPVCKAGRGEKNQLISLRLPVSLVAAADQYAQARNSTRAATIRQALVSWLKPSAKHRKNPV